MLKLWCQTLAFAFYKAFLKYKKTSGVSFPASFSEENCFSPLILLADQVSLSECLYFLRYLEICLL